MAVTLGDQLVSLNELPHLCDAKPYRTILALDCHTIPLTLSTQLSKPKIHHAQEYIRKQQLKRHWGVPAL